VGSHGPDRTVVIEAGHVRRWCEAIGDPNPRWREFVPPTFFVALGDYSLLIPEALDYGKGWLNGGNRFELLEPVRIGEKLTSQATLVEAFEKQGSSGSMLFLVTETEFKNELGAVVARTRGTTIRR
jgi:hypothetical protein